MVTQDGGLIALRRISPGVEGAVGGRRDHLVERVQLQPMALLEMRPIEVGPLLRLHELGRRRNCLGTELADETDHPRHRRGEPWKISFVAVVPAEVQVAARAVEQWEMGRHTAVGDGGARLVGLFECSLHPSIEHRLVPRRQLLPGDVLHGRLADRRGSVEVRGDRLVVRTPHSDRRVMAELVDGLPRLADGLLANRAGIAPLQREVLPQQHPEFVGSVVQLRSRDVSVDTQQIEAGFAGKLDVATKFGGCRITERHLRRCKVGPLDEQRLAVDGEHPVVQRHLSEAGAHAARIADRVVDGDLDFDIAQFLITERPGPPQARFVDVQVPVDLVEAAGQRLLVLIEQFTVDPRGDADRSGNVAVEPGVQAQVGTSVVDVATQHTPSVDAHRACGFDPHRAPQAAGIPCRIHRVPVLEHAGDRPFRLAIELRRAGDFHGEHMLGGEARQPGDVEAVREEVTLRVAEVGAVQPHVGLVEDAVQGDEVALAFGRRCQFEPLPVEQRTVVADEWRQPLPVARHLYLGPVPVEVVEADCTATPLVVGNIGTPLSRQIHDGEDRRGVARTTAVSSWYGRRMATRAETLGQLKASGWQSSPVKEEIRRNAVARIAAGEALFEGVLGYGQTVMPQLENALLAGHDVIFLGERGQAKTRMIRSLTGLLDEFMPIIAGSEINDDPYSPVSRYARDIVAEHGEETPITWVHREDRFGEKLATPDTSIADLIGEVDPIKVAEGRYLSDELTLHYGLVPRTNRGIFAINELPDLAERIQVGLLNVLEERDVQVRGYKIRLPLDVMLVASANPDDYTNRGRIITPLKDRFGSQIRTHYPLEVPTEVAIIRQEARSASVGDVRVSIPDYMEDVIANLSHLARSSNHVNQRSGVSVRLSVSNTEVLGANALRRGLRAGEREVVPRVCDLSAIAASTSGKIEIESLEEGREGAILENLVRAAVLTVYKERVSPDQVRDVIMAFDEEGMIAHTGEDVSSAELVALLERVPALSTPVRGLTGGNESPAAVAGAVEFVLEGLHLSKRLNKDSAGSRATYRAR